MTIKKIVVGFLQTNCYILYKNNNCLIIDPGSDYTTIIEEAKNLNILGILLTHRHPDHIGALQSLITNHNIDVYDKTMDEGYHNIGPFSFEVIYNSGHTNDSISFYFKENKALFSGDFLFKGTIGRTDLPTGNDEEMKKSLKMISKYDTDITIYPGHGEESTLGHEFTNNPYFKSI